MRLLVLSLTLATLLQAPALISDDFATTPPAPWQQGDPGDSLYRAARRALTDREYVKAAGMFDAIVTRYPRSAYAPDALYWKGFALYRQSDLLGAQTALEAQASRFPQAATRSDGAALLVVVKGELAKRGSAAARRDVDSTASAAVGGSCRDMEVQIAALDAVRQMDEDRAVPLLRRVLARREECSVPLRKNALFILAQTEGSDRERVLLDIAKTDPSLEVRKDAIFHLSAARSPLAVDALEEVLLRGSEPALRSDALFSLAQMETDRAKTIVRTFALSAGAPLNLRKDAFFHLAQGATDEDLAWLRQAYARVDDVTLRKDLLFHIANHPSAETSKWLIKVAADNQEALDTRKDAIFHLAQRTSDPAADLSAVYDAVPAELKRDVIFHLGQRDDERSLDKLIAIAKSDPTLELRKDALFHLGQSKNPKALRALEEIVAP